MLTVLGEAHEIKVSWVFCSVTFENFGSSGKAAIFFPMGVRTSWSSFRSTAPSRSSCSIAAWIASVRTRRFRLWDHIPASANQRDQQLPSPPFSPEQRDKHFQFISLEKWAPQWSSRTITSSYLSSKNRGRPKAAVCSFEQRPWEILPGSQGQVLYDPKLLLALFAGWALQLCHNHGCSDETEHKWWMNQDFGTTRSRCREKDSSLFTALAFYTPSSQAGTKTLLLSNPLVTHFFQNCFYKHLPGDGLDMKSKVSTLGILKARSWSITLARLHLHGQKTTEIISVYRQRTVKEKNKERKNRILRSIQICAVTWQRPVQSWLVKPDFLNSHPLDPVLLSSFYTAPSVAVQRRGVARSGTASGFCLSGNIRTPST